MKNYTSDELATIVQKLICKKFDSPLEIKKVFAANIKGKVKSISSKELTETELETKSLKIAKSVFDDLNRIDKRIIEAQLSS